MRSILTCAAMTVALVMSTVVGCDTAHASAAKAPTTARSVVPRQPRVIVRGAVARQGSVTPARSMPEMRAVGFARSAIGTPYVWGGESRSGYDCSGLVQAAWRHAGVKLPRVSYEMWASLRKHRVSPAHLKPGDVLFFHNESHVGLYVGKGYFIHAPHTGSHVKLQKLAGWYRSELDGADRPVPWPVAVHTTVVHKTVTHVAIRPLPRPRLVPAKPASPAQHIPAPLSCAIVAPPGAICPRKWVTAPLPKRTTTSVNVAGLKVTTRL